MIACAIRSPNRFRNANTFSSISVSVGRAVSLRHTNNSSTTNPASRIKSSRISHSALTIVILLPSGYPP
jgi:hypothetical protein